MRLSAHVRAALAIGSLALSLAARGDGVPGPAPGNALNPAPINPVRTLRIAPL